MSFIRFLRLTVPFVVFGSTVGAYIDKQYLASLITFGLFLIWLIVARKDMEDLVSLANGDLDRKDVPQ